MKSATQILIESGLGAKEARARVFRDACEILDHKRLEIASRILAASVRHVVPSGAECDYADVCNESLKVADALIAAHNATDTGEK